MSKSTRTRTPNNVRTLTTELAFGESPRWHDGRLWFVDFGAEEVGAVDLGGNRELIARTSDMPMGIDFLPDGRLLIVSVHEGKLRCQEPDGSLTTYADLSAISGKPWGELLVDGRGNAYIGNLGFDFPGGEFAPGSVALVTPDGTVRQAAAGLAFPNGMAVAPDSHTLVVAESYGEQLTAFDIAMDGSLSNQHVWARTPGDHPDGICLDVEGAVWYADVGTKRCVRIGEGGEVLQTVELDRGCFACMLGGPDRKTLFIMAAEFPPASWGPDAPRTGLVKAVDVDVAGAGWPRAE
jgi:sugar lactone lactonase YvrE